MPTISVAKLDENPHETVNGIRSDTSSRGIDLDGAQITATYADGTTETLVWQALDPYTLGGASGPSGLAMSYGFDWHELSTSKLLTSLRIDLQPASSVFDTNLDNDDFPDGNSTPTSLSGFPFELSPDYQDIDGEIGVTYSGIVSFKGSPAVGDLYTTMEIDFSNLPAGGLLGELKWNSDIDTMENAGDLVSASAPCIVRGTLITTDRGDVPVESLKPGCKVLTKDNGFQELVFLLNRVVNKSALRSNEKLYPVRITAGALGSGLPRRDLVVSRQHRIAVRSNIVRRMFGSETALVAAIRLTDLPGIQIDDTAEQVEYFHLVFKQHEIVFAEGTPTESFLVNFANQKSLSRAQREELFSIFPESGDPDYLGLTGYEIPSRMAQKELVHRHLKNAKALVSF